MRIVEWHDGATWDAFVHDSKDATVMHLYAWKHVLERAYGLQTCYLAAVEAERLRGLLPLARVGTAVSPRYLVSMPFMDYGGVCGDGDEEVERALVTTARGLARRFRATLLLRYLRNPGLDLPLSLDKATMFLNLGQDASALWQRLPAERRNRIRKGQRLGVRAELCGPEGLGELYAVLARCMRDLGSPVHSARFFQEIVSCLGDRARILLVRDQTGVVGGALMLMFSGVLSIPWVASLRESFHKCPNQVLYWEAMNFGIREGYRVLDFGRSSRVGTSESKRQWGPDRVQLYWYYDPNGRHTLGADPIRLGWAARVWRQLPLPVANLLGPLVRHTLPN
jgi:FemAB-related protein (PEP-CTERM system-associated)